MPDAPHVLIATPSYDGRLGFGYVAAREETGRELSQRGIDWSPYLLGGCSIIEMARQEIVGAFLDSPATHLLMIDSDIAWRASDLVRMIEADEPLVFAVAPRRLSNDFAVRYLGGDSAETVQPNARGLIEVETAGGGFALIRRDVIKKMQAAYPELAYKTESGQARFALYLLELAEGGLFGEDYAFCRRWRKIGGRVWVDPNVWLRHSHGSFHVEGCLSDILPRVQEQQGSHLDNSIWSLPSRGRPASMERFLDAYRETDARCPVFVWIDSDDPERPAYEKIDYPPHWTVRVGPRFANRCNGVIEEMFRSFPNASCYGLLADDIVPRTPRWDARLANAAGRARLSYGDDRFQGRALATHPVIGGDLARTIGWLILPEVKHLFADTALHTIAKVTGRMVYLPQVVTEHMHPLAGKATEDSTYQYRESFTADHDAFLRWSESGLPGIVARVTASAQ